MYKHEGLYYNTEGAMIAAYHYRDRQYSLYLHTDIYKTGTFYRYLSTTAFKRYLTINGLWKTEHCIKADYTGTWQNNHGLYISISKVDLYTGIGKVDSGYLSRINDTIGIGAVYNIIEECNIGRFIARNDLERVYHA